MYHLQRTGHVSNLSWTSDIKIILKFSDFGFIVLIMKFAHMRSSNITDYPSLIGQSMKELEDLYFTKNKPCLLLVDKNLSFDTSFKGDFNLNNETISRDCLLYTSDAADE